MGTLAVYGGDLYTPFEVVEDGAVFARDGVIERVGPRAQVVTEAAHMEVDVRGRMIFPGFVDLQVNGGGDVLLTEQPDVDAADRIAEAHVRFGTTSLLATVVTAGEPQMIRALEAVSASRQRPSPGATVLGAHLEGPFINPVRRGAHDNRFIRTPDLDLFDRLLAAASGSLRLVTLAPELPGAIELIERAAEAATIVALGHTEATFDEARQAIDAGASLGTHVFNAMRGFSHREPGVVGALLAADRAAAGVIADGVHVHPAALALVARAKGASRTALVTDAMPPVGGERPAFRLNGREVTARDGACYLPDGTLAGSALSMNRAVDVMSRLAGVPLRDCVQMATATPAEVLGMQDEIGVLVPGAKADIAVCDAELNVWRVFVGGEQAYAAND